MTPIQYTCPECNGKFDGDDGSCGFAGVCPLCGEWVELDPPPANDAQLRPATSKKTMVTGQSIESESSQDNEDMSRNGQPVQSEEWRQFFASFPLHKGAQLVLMAFVKEWPAGLDPEILSTQDLTTVLDRVRQYQTMPYPVKILSGLEDARPNYQVVDGKIARRSDPFLDMLICNIAPSGEKAEPGDQPGHVVFRLIDRYAQWPLAKLVFLLPRVHDASEARILGKAALVVVQAMLIEVYKGIENVLFDVYEELPEGGRLSEELIERKLISLLAPPS